MINTVDEIIDRLGGLKATGDRLGVGNTAVCNWRVREHIPACHYFALREILVDEGHGEPSPELFKKKEAAT